MPHADSTNPSQMSDITRLKYWTGKATGKPECPYCKSNDITEAEPVTKSKGDKNGHKKNIKGGGRAFTCNLCQAHNHFGRSTVKRSEL